MCCEEAEDLKKVDIILAFDDEKLAALEFCLKKEKATVKGRLDEALAQLYEQSVPAPLREYLDSRAAPPRRPSRPAPPKAAPANDAGSQPGKENADHGQ